MDFGKPWVLLTGNVREPAQVIEKLVFISKLLRKGLIENFVFSTWIGEIEKDRYIQQILTDTGGIVVETNPPSIMTRGSYLHQIVQIDNGLQVIPDNVFILKVRTDKCSEVDGFNHAEIIDILTNKTYIQPVTENLQDILEYRIGLHGKETNFSLTFPFMFFFNDRWYFIFKKDFKKFLNFKVLDFDYLGIIPEQALLATPFTVKWSILLSLFRGIRQGECIGRVFWPAIPHTETFLNMFGNFLITNPVFIDAFLAERYIISEFFYDVATQQPIPLNTKFRGIELNIDNRLDLAKNPTLLTYDTQEHIKKLQNYLQEHFDISPIIIIKELADNYKKYRITRPDLYYLKFPS